MLKIDSDKQLIFNYVRLEALEERLGVKTEMSTWVNLGRNDNVVKNRSSVLEFTLGNL